MIQTKTDKIGKQLISAPSLRFKLQAELQSGRKLSKLFYRLTIR